MGFGGLAVKKNPHLQCKNRRGQVESLGGESPLEEEHGKPISGILAWKVHGQEGLVGYSPQDAGQIQPEMTSHGHAQNLPLCLQFKKLENIHDLSSVSLNECLRLSAFLEFH